MKYPEQTETGWLEESRDKDGRCDLFQGGHGSKLAPLGIFICVLY